METFNLTMELRDVQAQPISGVSIKVITNRAMPYPAKTILPTDITATTDENGRASIPLTPSLTGTFYTLTMSGVRFQPLQFQMPAADISLTDLVAERLAEDNRGQEESPTRGGGVITQLPAVEVTPIDLPTLTMTAPRNLTNWGPWFQIFRETNNEDVARLTTVQGSLVFNPFWHPGSWKAEVQVVINVYDPDDDHAGGLIGTYSHNWVSYIYIPNRSSLTELGSTSIVFSYRLPPRHYIKCEARFRSQFPNDAGKVTLERTASPLYKVIYRNL